MQIIIDIPEDIIRDAKSSPNYYPTYHFEKIWRAIVNSTSLPKRHGKLIDEKEIDTVVNGVFNNFDKYSPKTFLNVIHEQCIEVVGVDKTERENKECRY